MSGLCDFSHSSNQRLFADELSYLLRNNVGMTVNINISFYRFMKILNLVILFAKKIFPNDKVQLNFFIHFCFTRSKLTYCRY